MANRSDFLSTYPRSIKRLILLGKSKDFITEQASVIKDIFITAHRSHQAAKRKATKQTTRDQNNE